ncbi:hypothetical protein ACEWY4_013087 [Coilia grayii]|uniref:Cortactin-binding protein-2 N-terminal domain-containing protein n=1 Tax=Coilia grayii TaxID=363190 RepID=A0ABD1JVD8_9TELE
MRGPRAGPSVGEPAVHPDPLTVLKLVVGHCRRMQEKMLAQLAAAESRHRRVIADLEEEKRRHAEDTAEGDDVTCILEKERERLQQQLEFERGQSRRLEREHRRLQEQLEEERAQHKQLASALARECQRASSRLQEEGHRAGEASRRLDRERLATQSLRAQLEAEKRRALQTEARAEEQLAEVDTEREQLRARLRREETQSRALQQELERLRGELERALQGGGGGGGESGLKEVQGGGAGAESGTREVQERRRPLERSSVTTQMDLEWEEEEEEKEEGAPKMNGHLPAQKEQEENGKDNSVQDNGLPENRSCPPPHAVQNHIQGQSSLSASPCSSPMLAKRAGQAPQASPTSSATAAASTSVSTNSGSTVTLQSSYQAGIHQRFHAARHKFQGHPDPEPQTQASGSRGGEGGSPSSPRALSPCSTPSPEASPARQMARSTVTQVLSRFTVQQPGSAKPTGTTATAAPAPNSSPFGTDYRNMAPSSPSLSASSRGTPSGALSPGIRSPVIPRAERGNPPPIPPKKPGLAQAPPSPATVARANHSNHFAEPLSPTSCGLTSGQDGVKELDMVLSSSG